MRPILSRTERAFAALAAAGLGMVACGVDYQADQAEYDRRLCEMRGIPCPVASGGSASGGTQSGGAGGSSSGTAGRSVGGSAGVTSAGSGGQGDGGSGGSPTCSDAAARCTNGIREVCTGGEWLRADCEEATPACEAGECVACVNGTGRCTAAVPEECVNHAWVAQTACAANTICQSGECVSPPSCQGLTANCGSDGEYCCESSHVPGGEYFRSNDGLYPATVSEFMLDKFEVTVGRMRNFIEGYPANLPSDGDGAHRKIPGTGWDSSWNAALPVNASNLVAALKCNSYSAYTDAAGANENMPIGCVSWKVALAFCIWDGGRLPTEAEWNYAAAGGDEQRLYPWGDTAPGFDATYAAFDCNYDGATCAGSCCLASIAAVGSIPAGNGRWGHADLAGNLAEWNYDSYDGGYPTPCVDCAQTAMGVTHSARGGYFSAQAAELLNSARGAASESGGATYGLRCAREP